MHPDSLTPLRVEIVPVDGIVTRVVAEIDPAATITVTSLPKHGVERTVLTAIELAEGGRNAVPHLAARQISSVVELRRILEQLSTAGITELFIVGGDAASPAGPFSDGLQLLNAVRDLRGDEFRLGVGAYPEGHPHLGVDGALELLRIKQSVADYAVTQLCFDPDVLAEFLVTVRAIGVTLPVWLGIPAPVRLRKLMAIGASIGVGTSLAFATKGAGIRRLVDGTFDAEWFRSRVAEATWSAGVSFAGRHVYSFNDLAVVDER